ncbi:MAG: hypothetical protein KID04_14410 [Clostridium sp.]|nr:hypothetical protein [Clostridium sp.]
MNETKAKTCPKCGNPDCEETDEFCFNCGILLKNHCSDERCISNSDGDYTELPENFCFCPICGAKTEYYENGYITPTSYRTEQ